MEDGRANSTILFITLSFRGQTTKNKLDKDRIKITREQVSKNDNQNKDFFFYLKYKNEYYLLIC